MSAQLAGCLAELEHRALLPADRMAVFVGGSVARGWDNPGSDYDIYVVSSKAWSGQRTHTISAPLHPKTVSMLVLQVDGRRWELKYWLDLQVGQVLAKVTWARFENGGSSAAVLTDNEELLLERLATCVPLDGHEWVRRRRDDLNDSAFRAFVITRSLIAADSCVEDALGQLAARDLESAVLSARLAFGHTVDAVLESHGHYGARTLKWRARRFREAAPPELTFESYWALETMADLDRAAPEAWVEKVVSVCKKLSLEVEI